MCRYIQKAISIKKSDEIANLLFLLVGAGWGFTIYFIMGDFGKEPLLLAKAMCGIMAVTYFFGNVFFKVMFLPEEVMRGLSFGLFMWIEGLVGNNVIRYGKMAYWIYYFAVVSVIGVLPRIIRVFPGLEICVRKFTDGIISPGTNCIYVWCIISIFVIVGIVVNWLTLRKIPVKNAV